MVREVVEEDVFVVVLRPHADRDEEATRRNIICDLCVNFFFSFFWSPHTPGLSSSRPKRAETRERELERERERENESLFASLTSHVALLQ
jgi:hypothetical protein